MEQEFFNLITKINGENFILVAFAVGWFFALKRMTAISTNDSAILADWTELNSALARKDGAIAKLNENISRLNGEILELHKIVSDLRAKLDECLKHS
jgi:hypothetical protein